jgi:signal transduction histidine kinase
MPHRLLDSIPIPSFAVVDTPSYIKRAAFFGLGVAIAASAVNYYLYTAHRQRLKNQLVVSLEVSNRALANWYEGQLQIVAASSRSKDLEEIIDQKTRSRLNEDVPQKNRESQAFQSFSSVLHGPLNDTDFSSATNAGFVVTDDSFRVLASSINIEKHSPVDHISLNFFKGSKGCKATLPVKSEPWFYGRADAPNQTSGHPVILIGCPFESGGTSGWLINRVFSNDSFASILKLARLGESGETYAINSDGILISPSRFFQDLTTLGLAPDGRYAGVLDVRVADPEMNLTATLKRPDFKILGLTKMAKSIQRKESGVDVDGYRDYRGIEVVGAWKWNETYSFGITHEIDLVEARKNQLRTQNLIFIAAVIVIVLGLGVIHISDRHVKLWKKNQEMASEHTSALLRLQAMSVGQQLKESSSLLVHELSQPLTALLNLTSVLINMSSQETQLDYQAKSVAILPHMKSKAEFCADILARTRRELRRLPMVKSVFSLSKLINKTVSLIQTELQRLQIVVNTNISEDFAINGDEIQIQQVLVNILKNSMESISSSANEFSGRISISVLKHKTEDSARHYSKIIISDNGSGFDPSIIDKAFFPGTTSKETGSGLGLAISKRIVEAHEGLLTLENDTVGIGAIVAIVIPV